MFPYQSSNFGCRDAYNHGLPLSQPRANQLTRISPNTRYDWYSRDERGNLSARRLMNLYSRLAVESTASRTPQTVI